MGNARSTLDNDGQPPLSCDASTEASTPAQGSDDAHEERVTDDVGAPHETSSTSNSIPPDVFATPSCRGSRGRLHSIEESPLESMRRRSSTKPKEEKDGNGGLGEGGVKAEVNDSPNGNEEKRQSNGRHFLWFQGRRANQKVEQTGDGNNSPAQHNSGGNKFASIFAGFQSLGAANDSAGEHAKVATKIPVPSSGQHDSGYESNDTKVAEDVHKNSNMSNYHHQRPQIQVTPIMKSALSNGGSSQGRLQNRSMAPATSQGVSPLVLPMAPPIGLLGPSSIEFSPSVVGNSPALSSCVTSASSSSATSSKPPLHLAFLSCSHHIDAMARSAYTCSASCHNDGSNTGATTEIRRGSTGTMQMTEGSGARHYSQSQQAMSLERRLYVVNLEPLLKDHFERDSVGDEIVKKTLSDLEGQVKTTSFDSKSVSLDETVFLQRRGMVAKSSIPLVRQNEQNAGNAFVDIPKNAGNGGKNTDSTSAPSQNKANNRGESENTLSLQERLRRERQRFVNDDGDSGGFTQFDWSRVPDAASAEGSILDMDANNSRIRVLVPNNGNIFVQDGVGDECAESGMGNHHLSSVYDKRKMAWDLYYTRCWEDMYQPYGLLSADNGNLTNIAGESFSSDRGSGQKDTHNDDMQIHLDGSNSIPSSFFTAATVERFFAAMEATDMGGCPPSRDLSAIDPQLSPDGTMVAFVVAGEIYVVACDKAVSSVPTGHCCGHYFPPEVTNPNDGDNEHEEQAIRGCRLPIELQQRMPIRITFGSETEDGMHLDGFFRELFDARPNTRDSCRSPSQRIVRSQSSSSKTASSKHITHGLADFVAQEEMDRYRGFWWSPDSKGIVFAQVDESNVPPYRIMHEGRKPSSNGLSSWGLGSGGGCRSASDAASSSRREESDDSIYEDHRYPFAGKMNPVVRLGYVEIDRSSILGNYSECGLSLVKAKRSALWKWDSAQWFGPPPLASEYLARVSWLPDGSVCAQWQNRHQSVLQLVRIDVKKGEESVLLTERSDIWINLHNMLWPLDRPIHPNECYPKPMTQTRRRENTTSSDVIPEQLPSGSFSFLFASERTGFSHLYLYTYVAGSKDGATLVRAISGGDWAVEEITGVDLARDCVYVTGTFDSPLEKHLYALPITNKYHLQSFSEEVTAMTVLPSPPDPIRLTNERGMHNIVMDDACRVVVDTYSDLDRPPFSQICAIHHENNGSKNCHLKLLVVLHDSEVDDMFATPGSTDAKQQLVSKLRPPDFLTLRSHDSTEVLHAALYIPSDKSRFGHGPYPLVCSVYGGPHVQRVNRSWASMTADMRAQRLAAMGFAVLKCDNRGSSRRGLKFEGSIKGRLGSVEVLDQVAAVKQIVDRRIADPSRVGIYGWSYGGYLAAMCLCRAPDVFHVGVAGAPVTCWSYYDTHYTERYMGIPDENEEGYKKSAVFNHVSNLKGKLMLVHGLIDENVHFRHTAQLINQLVSEGKDYDLMVFPDERHSPRRLSDRLYMEKKICEYFVRNLTSPTTTRPYI